MKFTSLEIENFLAITHAEIQLADRGLILVQGVNNADTSADSNGAGKSSIPDALCWAWFGTTARGLTGDDVVNFNVGKNCMVRSKIQDGGFAYTATRHRKHKTGKNTLTITAYDGLRTVDLTKGTDKLTQDVANTIIGASLEVFSGSIYAGQEQMPDLPSMTDKALKMLIEEASGVTALEGAYKKAREEALEIGIRLKDASALRLGLISTQDRLTIEVVDMEDLNALWATEHAAEVAMVRDRLIKVDGPEVQRLSAEIDAVDRAALVATIADCDAKIASVAGEQTTLSDLRAKAVGCATKADACKQAVDTNTNRQAQAATNLANISHKIGCPCDECGRPLTGAELVAATKAAQDRLDLLVAERTGLEKARTDAINLHERACDAALKFQGTLTDVSAVAAVRASFARSVSDLDALVTQRDWKLAKLRQDTTDLKAKMGKTSPHLPLIERLKTDLAEVEKKDIAAKAALARVGHDAHVMAEVVKVFSPAGVRARILDDVTPYLNTQTSKYLSIMSDGNINATWTTLIENAKGEFKEKFTIDVANSTGGKVFRALSGGEKRKVRIATALALQDLVSTRATKPIEIFIGDEIDDALDPAGLERLMIILEEKATERGTVLIISHADLKDSISNVITVEKTLTGETIITDASV